MCLAETLDHHHDHPTTGQVDRRRFLMGGGAVAAGVALAATSSLPAAAEVAHRHRRRSRVVDLTHRLRKDFPTFTHDQPTDEVIADFATAGFYAKRWTIGEHTGTHIDTPGHFSEGMRLVDELEADELLAPIVIVDIRRKALDDPNAMVEPDDLLRFERRHGRIPQRALVCMDSGWAAKADDPLEFLGGPAFPDYNFPGFSIEATDWLLARRNPVGIGVDTVQPRPWQLDHLRRPRRVPRLGPLWPREPHQPRPSPAPRRKRVRRTHPLAGRLGQPLPSHRQLVTPVT